MKVEQFRYVLEIYRTGSISKAAKKFYMSRPNMSNSIKSLEQEVGFEILERGTSGVKFTEKGMKLVLHCMNIVKEVDKVQNLSSEKTRLEFSVVSPNWPAAENAFIRLCCAAENREELFGYRFSMYRAYQYESMLLLNQRKADLAITLSRDLDTPSLTRELRERGLVYRKIRDVPCNVNLSVNHPLTKEKDFRLEKLRQYPFVDYAIDSDRGNPYNRLPNIGFVNLDRLIRVDSGNMRTRTVASTNAYGIGIAMPPDWQKAHGLCSFPIPGLILEIGYIRRQGEPVLEPEQQFMDFLKEETAFLDQKKETEPDAGQKAD